MTTHTHREGRNRRRRQAGGDTLVQVIISGEGMMIISMAQGGWRCRLTCRCGERLRGWMERRDGERDMREAEMARRLD
jgi:hypothetical protein